MIGRILGRLFGRLILTGGLALSAASLSAQTTLDADGMRAAAGQSLQAGRPAQAEALAAALLSRDAKDLNALLLRSRALRDLGR